MGILSWWRGDSMNTQSQPQPQKTPPPPPPPKVDPLAAMEVPGMNGAVEVPRPPPPANITVFEFGSVAATEDKVTLAGYCPVSDDLEPCRWEILPAAAADAPQFRVAF